MRRNSKGNIYHIPAGDPQGRGGQFASKAYVDAYNERRRTLVQEIRDGESTKADYAENEKTAPVESVKRSFEYDARYFERTMTYKEIATRLAEIEAQKGLIEKKYRPKFREMKRLYGSAVYSNDEFLEETAKMQLELYNNSADVVGLKIAKRNLFLKSVERKDFTDDECLMVHHRGKVPVTTTENCVLCAAAWEFRKRGYDVHAGENGIAKYQAQPYLTFWQDPENRLYDVGVREIESQLKEWGDGARAMVNVKWRGKSFGHAFVAENINGEIHFLDPQTNDKDCRRYFKKAEKGGNNYVEIRYSGNVRGGRRCTLRRSEILL